MTRNPDADHEGTRLRQFSALIAVATCLAVGALMASSSPLYAQIYPPEGSNNLTAEEFAKHAERALTTARVRTGTTPSPVVQYESAELVATLIIGADRPLSPLPQVQVAYDNEASLRPKNAGAVEVSPDIPIAKSMKECTPLPAGRCELSWTWTIVPQRPGTQTLLLTVSPLIWVDGQVSKKYKERNEPIPVVVEVNPVLRALDVAKQATRTLETDVPDRWSAGRPATVSATLAEPWPPDIDVEASITLDTPGSPQTIITPQPATQGSGTLTQSWSVEPAQDGVLKLVFTALVAGKAGEKVLTEQYPTTISVHVSATIWDRISAPVGWLGGIVALAAGMLGLWTGWRRLRSGDGSA